MKPVLILCAVVALVQGRPEAPSGYNYQAPPSARYGAPSGGQGAGFSNGQASAGVGSGSGFGAGSGFGSGSAGSFAGSFGSGSGSGFGVSGQATSSSQSGGSSSRDSSANGADSGTIVINKHVYVHVAPPELEEQPQQKAQVRVPPPQKNYKIIFIKAPAPAATQAPQIPPIPQNEEKTLVYVLVKKPEEQAEIEIPTAAPTEPSRPEVYFIKYKTQQESGGQQGATGGDDSDTVEVGARGQGGAAQGGAGATQGGFGAAQGAGAGGNQGDAAGRQGGASAGGYSYSSSSSASSSSAVSRQYGAPSSSGPY